MPDNQNNTQNINEVDSAQSLNQNDKILISNNQSAVKKVNRDTLAYAVLEEYSGSQLAGKNQTVTAAVGNIHQRLDYLEKNGLPEGTIEQTVSDTIEEYIQNGQMTNLTIADHSLPRSKVDQAFENTLAKADGAMQTSVYDPNGYGIGSSAVDPYTFAQRQDTAKKREIVETDTYTVVDSKNTSTSYTGLANALNGVLNRAETYADAAVGGYTPTTIQVVSALPEIGVDNTFYLIPKESGSGYDKYWYITDQNGNKKWDNFGSSSTVVVSTLPTNPDPGVDYILAQNGEYKYYKWIDNVWALIAGGSAATTIELDYPLHLKGDGNPTETQLSTAVANENKYYLDMSRLQVYKATVQSGQTVVTWGLFATLVANPSATTDYFVKDTGVKYFHFRYKNNQFYMVGSDGYSKSEIDQMFNTTNTNVSTNAGNITALGTAIEKVAQDLRELDIEGMTYYAALSQDENQNYVYTLYEVSDGEESIKSQFTLPATGGGGGGTAATTLVVDRITESPVICTPTDRVVIEIDFSSTDSDGQTVDATYSIKRGTSIVMNGQLVQGRNSFDLTDYCSVGTQKFTLTVTDEGGSVNVKTWTVQIADVRFETSFNDRFTYPANSQVNFSYTPYGSVSKVVHFVLDGTELPSVTTSASGILQSYTLPAQPHGAHLLECWITATINNKPIETDHIFKDIIWYDDTSTIPVIGCIYRYDYYGEVQAKQYNTTSIPYVVYDPRSAQPNVQLSIDDVVYNNLRLSSPTNVWPYKSDEISQHVLTISCGETSVDIHMNIVELGYDISPVTGNLEFDFNPTGYSNSSANRLWHDTTNENVALTVSNNFDWDNGGYQLDANGHQYFCVKAGTKAYISYNLFGRDPKLSGAEFKVIFRTTNVRSHDASFLTCIPENEATVGIDMQVHNATVYTSSKSLFSPYSEEDIIEFEYNINTLDLEDSNAKSFIMAYEDGVGTRPLIYDNSHRLYQYQPVPITIGSDDCDVHIYRMKAYSSSLTDSNILKNFIADAFDSETMIARYERNQIYTENNELTPESVADACPDLKIIKIECPYFTNDKKNYIKNTNVECIHKNGDPKYDNWKFINGYHVGQGTTSNEYGYAGRNIDLIFGFDGEHQVVSKIPLETDYITELVLGDGTRYSDGSGKITLTRTSVPNNWLNIKVNIASSENANNALLQKRFNDYLPYQIPAVRRDPRIKNSMEFVNCVVFVKESNPDISTHREFQDTNWHFYAIGNIGDSKKTDSTRVNDPNDIKEFVVEISDNTLPNSWFQTGVYKTSSGSITYDPEQGVEMVYPITTAQWNNPNNLKRISLYDSWDDSFEFRYDMGTKDGETISNQELEAQQALSKQVWRDMYEFVITSSDSDFVSHLSDWFIVESPLYWYLFTERYTMIDSRAKNSFYHWGKTYITTAEAQEMGDKAQYYTIDNAAAAINNGYRFDLWNYDDDTALGINNSGELTMTYGKEDIDYKEDGNPSSGFIFNAAENVFWRRIRKLMYNQLQAMYLSRESLNCWSATSLISEFDAWQNQFPEELWRLDIERKYLRTYFGGTQRFLETMMNGRKRYQRRQFERDQEAYIGTKYLGTTVTSDQIMFRCNTPQTGVVVRPDYTLNIVPYSDMYLTVRYGNSPTPEQVRAKAGVEQTITTNLTEMDDTAILIYCASRIQALNNLSACYIHDNDFSKASKLKTLIIGSDVEGYENTFLTTLNMGNNTLLETLDIRNCPNLAGSINLSSCVNLETLYAEGTSVSSISFARNGRIKTIHFPESISSLQFLNLIYLTNLIIPSYENVETFISEYSNVDVLEILQAAINTLQTIRLFGIDWTLADTSLLNTCLAMNSSTLVGDVYIGGIIRNQELAAYRAAWPDLNIDYDPNSVIIQHRVVYVNDDADNTVLWETYVDQGGTPIDPVVSGIIEVPTKPTTDQYVYTYSGWDNLSTAVFEPRTIRATYETTTRTYTVRWYSRPGILLKTLNDVEYGTECVYLDEDHELPTWKDGELSGIYHVFTGWDKSTGYVTNDIDVYGIWESCSTLPSTSTPMNEMSAVQIYAICKSKSQDNYFSPLDQLEITLGHNFNFSNVESVEIGEDYELIGIPRDQYVSGGYYFDGTKSYTTDIVLFGEDSPSFTMAIDYQPNCNSTNQTIFSTNSGGTGDGIRLFGNSGNYSTLSFGDQTVNIGYNKIRTMLVLRHQAGSKYLYVYSMDFANSTEARMRPVTKRTMIRTNFSYSNEPLTFGAVNYSSGARFMGKSTIHWCKIWFADLGESIANELALWPHEKILMDYWGSGNYYYSDTDMPCSGTWVCNHILGSSTGGINGRQLPSLNYHSDPDITKINPPYQGTQAREYLNTILFKAFPYAWQSVIATVEVNAAIDNTSVAPCNDKIYLLSYRELTNSIYSSSYPSMGLEIGPSMKSVPWMTGNYSRDKYAVPRKYSSGDIDIYNNGGNTTAYEPSIYYQTPIKPFSLWYAGSYTYIFIPQDMIDQYGISVAYKADENYTSGGWLRDAQYNLRSTQISTGTNSNGTTYYYRYYGYNECGTGFTSSFSYNIVPVFSI